MRPQDWILRLGCAAALLLPAATGLGRDGAPAATPSLSKPPATQVLADRLRALEAEQQHLRELKARLEAGQAVDPAAVIAEELPPLLLPESAEDGSRITEAAADIVEEMLGVKRTETEKLLALKTRLERGEDVALPEVEDPAALGLAARQRALEASDAALAELRARLEALEEEARFRRAAQGALQAGGREAGTESAVLEDRSGQAPAAAGAPAGEAPAPGDETPPGPDTGLVADRTALALSCYSAGRLEEALQAFRAVDPSSRPEGPFVLYMVGRTLERLGRLDEAEQAYAEVAKQFPRSPWVEEADFARKVVAWKKEMGPIEGVPPEAARYLHPPGGEGKGSVGASPKGTGTEAGG